MESVKRNKALLFRRLQKENAFWSYDPASVSLKTMNDDMLIEKVMLHLDINDINRLFVIYPKAKIKRVWSACLCPLEPYYNSMNRLFAYMYFNVRNPDRYIKFQCKKHKKELFR